MEQESKLIDCPLCGLKGVIFKTPFKEQVIPGGTSNIGDYSIGFTGGEYDVHHHAKECTAMKHIYPIHKEHYLMIFLYKGDPPIKNGDLNHYEAYVAALQKVGLKIHNQNIRTEKQFKTKNLFSDNCDWEVEMYITSINETDICKHEPHIIDQSPGAAFSKLKDRLICGEVIKVTDSSGKQTLFQLHTDGREISIVTID